MTRDVKNFFVDKAPLQELVREQNARMGVVLDAAATAKRSQEVTAEALRRSGLRPEDNVGSCSIIAARDGGAGKR